MLPAFVLYSASLRRTLVLLNILFNTNLKRHFSVLYLIEDTLNASLIINESRSGELIISFVFSQTLINPIIPQIPVQAKWLHNEQKVQVCDASKG